MLRKDLGEKIAALNPSFLRFPGGCVTNVGTFSTYEECGYTDRRRTYQWKETIGPVEERATNWNFWGYNQSYGIGYLEYFELAEDLGAEPLPVALGRRQRLRQRRIPEMHDPAQIDRWVQDTLDLIEFANGDTAPSGAPSAPRSATRSRSSLDVHRPRQRGEHHHLRGRTSRQFRDAIVATYPDIKIISNSGPDDTGARFDTLWDFNRAQDVDLVDEHYYNDPSWFLANNARYDSYDREGPQVFLGEYASRGNTMVERPVRGRVHDRAGAQRRRGRARRPTPRCWPTSRTSSGSPDAIWFDNDESWETPNY